MGLLLDLVSAETKALIYQSFKVIRGVFLLLFSWLCGIGYCGIVLCSISPFPIMLAWIGIPFWIVLIGSMYVAIEAIIDPLGWAMLIWAKDIEKDLKKKNA